MRKRKYVAIIEKSKTGYAAYCPDIPGLAVTGETEAEVTRLLDEGIQVMREEYEEAGWSFPEPRKKP